MAKKEKKVHTGFRLSKTNIELLEEYEGLVFDNPTIGCTARHNIKYRNATEED